MQNNYNYNENLKIVFINCKFYNKKWKEYNIN